MEFAINLIDPSMELDESLYRKLTPFIIYWKITGCT
jgi:hypothetical protein